MADKLAGLYKTKTPQPKRLDGNTEHKQHFWCINLKEPLTFEIDHSKYKAAKDEQKKCENFNGGYQ
jgi:hypothetical protein